MQFIISARFTTLQSITGQERTVVGNKSIYVVF